MDVRLGEGFQDNIINILGGEAEAGDVIHKLRKPVPGCSLQRHQGFDGIRHDHEGDGGVRPDEAVVFFTPGSCMEHFRAVIAGAAGGRGFGADQTREADGAKINGFTAAAIRGQLPVMRAVVAAEVLAVELVTAVHGRGMPPLIFTGLICLDFFIQGRNPIGSNGAGVNEPYGCTLPLRLFNGQPEQVQRAFNVNAMSGFRVVLRFG